jgi:hypothetical protein
MTRQKKEEIIRETASPALLEEIEMIFDEAIAGEWETVKNFYDAFRWASDKSDMWEEWAFLRTPARKVHIALGEFVPMSAEEVAESGSLNGKPWDFKMNKTPYQWVGPRW